MSGYTFRGIHCHVLPKTVWSVYLGKMLFLVFVVCFSPVALRNQQMCSQVAGLIKDQGCNFYNETTLSSEAQLAAGIFISYF